MNPSQYLVCQKTPPSLDAETIKELEEVVRNTPWFNGAQVLYALNLFKQDDSHYPAQLKKAALYAPDRKILKGLINQLRPKSEPTVETHEIVLQEVIPADLPPVIPEPVKAPEREYADTTLRDQLLSIVHKRLSEIESEKQSKSTPVELPLSKEPPERRLLSKEELIEKFIREEPRISTPKTAFFNPSQSAVRSSVDDEEIVTETLARLYAEQGNLQKSVKIFEKLSLLFPEKSRYFAAQIEKINSK